MTWESRRQLAAPVCPCHICTLGWLLPVAGPTADPASDSVTPFPFPRTPRTLIHMEMPPVLLGGNITAGTGRFLQIGVCSSPQAPSLGAASRMCCGLRQNEAGIGPDAQKIAAISSEKGQTNK